MTVLAHLCQTPVFEWMLYYISILDFSFPPVHDAESYSQEPVNSNDESDIISRQSNRGQYNHHGDQACLRDASSSNAGCGCCDTWLKRSTDIHRWYNSRDLYFYSSLWFCFSNFCYLMVMIWPKFISILLTWAIKMAASASYRAVPSMFIVAPTGSTKRVIRLSILLFSSRHLKVTGSVAELRHERMEEQSNILFT